MRATWIVVAMTLLATACGGGLESRWTGSGELSEARFFDLSLNFRDVEKPTASLQFRRGPGAELAVCRLVRNERHVEFQMDPGTPGAGCGEIRNPLTFVGDFGHDVLTGQVLDAAARRVGVFRAFRVEE